MIDDAAAYAPVYVNATAHAHADAYANDFASGAADAHAIAVVIDLADAVASAQLGLTWRAGRIVANVVP